MLWNRVEGNSLHFSVFGYPRQSVIERDFHDDFTRREKHIIPRTIMHGIEVYYSPGNWSGNLILVSKLPHFFTEISKTITGGKIIHCYCTCNFISVHNYYAE